jgi:plasmid maintenance system antidote protein VapI
MSKDNEITEEELLKILAQMVDKWGSQRAVADQLKISAAFMSDILAGNRPVSDTVARRLGYAKVIKFRKEKETDHE